MDYTNFFKENCTQINAMTFGNVIRESQKYIKDDKCESKTKLLFSNYLFNKIYMYKKFSKDESEDICKDLYKAIDYETDPIIKSFYIRYKNNYAKDFLCKDVYRKRLNGEDDKNFTLQLINDKSLLKGQVQKDEILNHFIEWINRITDKKKRSNILDILLHNFPGDNRVINIFNQMRYKVKDVKTLYTDRQNVHDNSIQRTFKVAAKDLINWSKEKIRENKAHHYFYSKLSDHDLAKSLLFDLCQNESEKKLSENILNRLFIDTTIFDEDDDEFSMYDIFFSLMNYIHISENKNNLLKPLFEELRGMNGMCSTGHAVRFVNVLRGFDDRFEITIDFSKQLNSFISNRLSKSMVNATDEVIEGTYNNECKKFYFDFIKNNIQKDIEDLFKDYGEKDVIDTLPIVLENITNHIWNFDEEKRLFYEPLKN